MAKADLFGVAAGGLCVKRLLARIIEKKNDYQTEQFGYRDAYERAHGGIFRPFGKKLDRKRKTDHKLADLFRDLRKRGAGHALKSLQITAVCAHDAYEQQRRRKGAERMDRFLI